MRPITNILLVLSLICYVFLPFYDMELTGTVTGLNFTAGTVSQALSFRHILLRRRFPQLPEKTLVGDGCHCLYHRLAMVLQGDG